MPLVPNAVSFGLAGDPWWDDGLMACTSRPGDETVGIISLVAERGFGLRSGGHR
jgi:hypothetical protein